MLFGYFFSPHPLLVRYGTGDYSARRLANPNRICSDTTKERDPRIHFSFDTGGHQHVIPVTRVDAVYDNCRLDLTFVNAVMC